MLKPEERKFNPVIFWRTRRYLIYTVGLGVVALGLLLLGVYPQVMATLDLRSEAEKKKPQLESLERKLAQLENIRFQPEFNQLSTVEEALPSRKPLLELLTNLNAISLAHQVSISKFQISPGVVATAAAETQTSRRGNSEVETLDLAMAIEGNRTDVNEFLNSIEKISPFTTITKLSIANTQQEGVERSSADMTTNTFFFVKSITTTVDSPLPVIADHEKEVLAELSAFEIPNLPEQNEIIGGGLEDLFGVDPLQFQ